MAGRQGRRRAAGGGRKAGRSYEVDELPGRRRRLRLGSTSRGGRATGGSPRPPAPAPGVPRAAGFGERRGGPDGPDPVGQRTGSPWYRRTGGERLPARL